jgi:4-aminobutyrate aminotransferase-like enzyme
LTGAFGVAAAGHANPRVVQAGQRQMSRLLHAMGDVHPHEQKALLARALSQVTFERWAKEKLDASTSRRRRIQPPKPSPRQPAGAKTIFSNSGFESVETALKTAILATGKRGIVAFHGAYHGLGYGALNVTHRECFRGPFRSQLRQFGHFLPFPIAKGEVERVESLLQRVFAKRAIGAVLVEPVQARGGIHVPPLEFLPMLRRICDERGALLILDEIYTGFGRTGKWFACEHSGTAPDLICLGKAMTGGFPLSACVGRAGIMDAAWPVSRGEAIHTSTYLGHPVGCAMALAQIEEIRSKNLVERSATLGRPLLNRLSKLGPRLPNLGIAERGLGLMAGIELTLKTGRPATGASLRAIKAMLRKGFILLPEGEHASVISFTPPLIISERQLRRTVAALDETLQGIAGT